MKSDGIQNCDRWLAKPGADDHVVISSRARYARNVPRLPFPSRATPEELHRVIQRVGSAVRNIPDFKDGYALDLTSLLSHQRHFLKENHLISREMGKGGPHRVIFIDKDITRGIMINEEDHLRIFALDTGFSVNTVLNSLMRLEQRLEEEINFAYSERWGYLTACTSNTGTGMRLSALLHLPALHGLGKLQAIITEFPSLGLTVRGAYGENSEIIGDLFQISNEVTLGKSEEDIAKLLTAKTETIIRAEENARRIMFEKSRLTVENEVFRCLAILTNARLITSDEAVRRLSWLRIGVSTGLITGITHNEINRLMIRVQSGHIRMMYENESPDRDLDELRAAYLREELTP